MKRKREFTSATSDRLIIFTGYTDKIIEYFFDKLSENSNIEQIQSTPVEVINNEIIKKMKEYFNIMNNWKIEFIYDTIDCDKNGKEFSDDDDYENFNESQSEKYERIEYYKKLDQVNQSATDNTKIISLPYYSYHKEGLKVIPYIDSYNYYKNRFYCIDCDQLTAKKVLKQIKDEYKNKNGGENGSGYNLFNTFISFTCDNSCGFDNDDIESLCYLLKELEYCYMPYFPNNLDITIVPNYFNNKTTTFVELTTESG